MFRIGGFSAPFRPFRVARSAFQGFAMLRIAKKESRCQSGSLPLQSNIAGGVGIQIHARRMAR